MPNMDSYIYEWERHPSIKYSISSFLHLPRLCHAHRCATAQLRT